LHVGQRKVQGRSTVLSGHLSSPRVKRHGATHQGAREDFSHTDGKP
jgi:hypothetical protein